MEHLYLKIFVDLLLYDFIPIYNVPRRTYNLKNISLSADIYNCFFVIWLIIHIWKQILNYFHMIFLHYHKF